MRYDLISSGQFSDRRLNFIKKMKPGAIAVFYSNDLMPRSADQYFPFRQDSALFALSGLDQPGTILILYPDAKKNQLKEIAFILPPDPEHAIWNGDRLQQADAKKISGIGTIKTLDEWDKIMPALFRTANSIYINNREQDRFHAEIPSQNDRKAGELKKSYPTQTFLKTQPILRDILMIKHPGEIELMKRAVEVTGLAFDRVLKTIKTNSKEYEVEAELSYILSRNGCTHAFEPIVASGKSACTLHYIRNDQVIRPGTLVLLDFGAEYAYMASDMTRTIPVSGKFSKRQRQVYTSVLKVLNEITSMMNPGITIDQLNKEAGKLIEQELLLLKIITQRDVRNQAKSNPVWKKYFMHGVTHHLGYDVHDISNRSAPLKPGMVLTCEPGMYIPGENIGIRLENDILITRKGSLNLMESIPIHPDEIESHLNTRHG
ncbi:MAG TPA: Xaa-Pro aminopeptidase [Saprospiraceae bacterium]|nr:Xaa-Pro aminopeptidase [Saprospiraceae bacterium]